MNKVIKVSSLLDNSAYGEAIYGWGEQESKIRLGQKIRVSFTGLKPKTGYAYKEEGAWLGIRYTWRSMRWWSLLNYNNPLIKLEAEDTDEQGNTYWTTLWERGCVYDPDYESQWEACGACGEWNNPSEHNCSEEVVNA